MSANKYFELVTAYRSTRGHEVYWLIHSLAVSHGVFLGNHEELGKRLVAHSQFVGVSQMYQEGHRKELQAEFREIIRLLHNYVAGVKSLVDHTRRIAEKLLDKHNLDLYKNRIETEFTHDPETRFLHDLRNYLLHVTHPPIQTTMRFGKNSLDSVGVELSQLELLRWDGWKKPSVEFLQQNEQGIAMGRLVTGYEQKVQHFYKWLVGHFNQACKAELDEFWTKHDAWAGFCRQQGIPTTDNEFREYAETDKS